MVFCGPLAVLVGEVMLTGVMFAAVYLLPEGRARHEGHRGNHVYAPEAQIRLLALRELLHMFQSRSHPSVFRANLVFVRFIHAFIVFYQEM